MYYLFVVVLDGCMYSMNCVKLLDSNNIKYKKLLVLQNEKEMYKTPEINTFPQIYLKKKPADDSLLFGGYTDIKEFTDIFKNKKYNEKNIINFLSKKPLWNKKSLLRLIEIINI